MKFSGNGLEINRISWPRMAWLLAALIMLWHLLYVSSNPGNRERIIGSDGAGYYAYLPAVFIYHDLTFKFCQEGQPTKAGFPAADHTLFMNRTSDGKLINKYFIGTAALEMPFFLIAYGTAPMFGHHANGYSFPFQLAIALAAIFYTLLGLEQIRRLLQKKGIPEYIQAITILAIFLGTNLYHYSLNEPSMSHAFSFGIVAVFLNQAHNVFHAQNRRSILWMILALSLIILVRPVNGVVIFTLPFIAGSWKNFISGLRFMFSNIPMILFGVLGFAVLIFLQLYVWKASVGTWFADSYSGEHLNLTNVHFYNVLFSWRKGWFVYTPLMLLAVGGFFFLKSHFERFAFLGFLLLFVWVIASWQLWTYGGSLGMRPMIDIYAVMAIPLAFFLAAIMKRWRSLILVPVLLFVVALNLVQEYQYRWAILAYDEMTWPKYQKIFFVTNPGYMCIYDPGSLHSHTLPARSTKISTWIRTFEEDTTQGKISYWAITNEIAFEGKNAVKLDTGKVTAGLCVNFRDAIPDSLLSRTWIVVKSKVFLPSEKLTCKMAVSFRTNGIEYNWQAHPLFFNVDKTGSWQDFEYATKLPMPADNNGEVCIFLVHDDESVAYADNMQIEFWVEP